MRVNVYSEEMTDRVEIVRKGEFTGVRFYLELPVTLPNSSPPFQARGPFIHHPGDDDSSAVTFWGKSDLRTVLARALSLLNQHYSTKDRLRKSSEGSNSVPSESEGGSAIGVVNQSTAVQGEPTATSEAPAPSTGQGSNITTRTSKGESGGEPSTAPADTSGQTGAAGTAEASRKATGSPAPELPAHIQLLEGYRAKVGDKAFYLILAKARRQYPDGFEIGHWRTEVPPEVADLISMDLEDEIVAQREGRKGKRG